MKKAVASSGKRIPKPGEKVVLDELPPGLIDGLPGEDQQAILAIIGVPIRFTGIEEGGRARLEFVERIYHSIFVDPQYVKAAKSGRKRKKRRK
jgi:hypothetical protein